MTAGAMFDSDVWLLGKAGNMCAHRIEQGSVDYALAIVRKEDGICVGNEFEKVRVLQDGVECVGEWFGLSVDAAELLALHDDPCLYDSGRTVALTNLREVYFVLLKDFAEELALRVVSIGAD